MADERVFFLRGNRADFSDEASLNARKAFKRCGIAKAAGLESRLP
jgi:hypothetical protein